MVESGRTVADDDAKRLADTLAAAQSGDLARAVNLAKAALDDGVVEPLYFKLRAVEHERQGRIEDAITDFQSALAFFPDDYAALSALGLCLARSGRLPEALAAIEGSISLRPDYAPAHCNLGWTFEAAGDRARARSAYGQALAVDPNSVQALGSLATIAARSGDFDQARSYAARALAISPQDPVAGIAMAMAAVAAGEHQQAEARMRALAADPRQPDHERGVAYTVLGDALDQAGRAGEAFSAYTSANAILARLGTGPGEGNAPLAENLLSYFNGAAPSDWRRGPPPASPAPPRAHLFIVGFPRSGTTLMGQVLAAHPDCTVLDEQETLAEPARAFLMDTGGLDRLAKLDGDELEPFRLAYWRKIAAWGDVEGRVLVDKLPMNSLGLPLISKLFPDARVMFVRRDPRDVVLSCFRRQFAANAVGRQFFTLEGAARYYDLVMRLAELYLDKVELNLRIQRYEDLVADFDAQSGEMCRFIGLEWTPGLRDFGSAAQALEVATPSSAQVTRGLYGEGVGQWRRYSRELAPVLPLLAPWIERFGYASE
jgi:tetratricopeptide (TPR) repeat protein